MTLISLLVVLMLERFFKASALLEKELKVHAWFPKWQSWVCSKIQQPWFQGWGGIVFILGIPTSIVFALLDTQQGFLFWILQLVLSVLVIIYCLGPIDQNAHLQDYFEAIERDDFQAAYHQVDEYLDLKNQDEKPKDINSLGRMVTRLILSQSNFRYFAVLVYFVLLGPAGALLYRLTATFEFSVRDDEKSSYRLMLHEIRNLFDWLPSRITAILYSLAGDFVGAIAQLKHHIFSVDVDTNQLLETTGLGAICVKDDHVLTTSVEVLDENKQALALVNRTAIVLLAIIAALTVSGWLY